MARPKKKPEYDSEQMAQQIMEAVTDAYLNPPQGTEDDTGHMQLKQLAEEFSMTPLKVRKLLITTGAYQTAISKAVNTPFREGKSVAEIQELTNLSRASVQSYLPSIRWQRSTTCRFCIPVIPAPGIVWFLPDFSWTDV